MHRLLPFLVVLIASPSVASEAVTRFGIVEPPRLDLPGNLFTNPIAINDAGQITGESGSSLTTIGMHAFLWAPGQPMIDLDQGAWPATTGLKINQAGVMAGDATFCPEQDGSCAAQPLLLQSDGTILELGPVYVGYLVVTGINEQNQVIYNRADQSGSFSVLPHQWSPNTGDSTLPIPSTSFSGRAIDQNDAGVVVGYSVGGGYTPHIRTDGTISSLQVEEGGDGIARAINNAGIIVGEADFDGDRHAARWSTPAGQAERLVDDPDVVRSEATKLYEDGTVLGTWEDGDNRVRPLRIAPDGTVDLFGLPEHPQGTFDLIPIGSTVDGWLICRHLSQIYESQPVVWIPNEGWVFTNDRLVGPGSNTSEQPADCNALGQIITRGSSWSTPSLLEPMPPGDVNGDRHVGVDDLLGVISYWGQCSPSTSRVCPADLTIDGLVNVEDLLGVISNWN